MNNVARLKDYKRKVEYLRKYNRERQTKLYLAIVGICMFTSAMTVFFLHLMSLFP